MTFDELRALIANSHARDWQRIKLMGPTYRDRFGAWSSPADGTSGLDHDTHAELAVYRPDIDLTIAYGMPQSQHGHSLTFKWSEAFPDSEIREISIADIFWRGSLVDRVNYVYVDGGRGIVPIGGGHQGLRINRYQLAVARLLSGIADYDEWERYFGAVPFELQD
ncbi:hypothetical protein A5642_15150 [Mycolicibacterium mucogenicum]|uniref:Uncharacterized protein n=1 Tax=Mycolicibacterium mucogenicum TaxID=56689 RepID=A0A1A0MVB7_MYCMU|nr:hypothetical protein [Mycolicibacterium mucogenicum]OBA89340.1 hypothetical protein A5642_15150 [Mycolicibacterium mucogenicum]